MAPLPRGAHPPPSFRSDSEEPTPGTSQGSLVGDGGSHSQLLPLPRGSTAGLPAALGDGRTLAHLIPHRGQFVVTAIVAIGNNYGGS